MSDKLANQIVDAVWNCHAQYADGTVWLDNLQAVIYVKKLLAESSTQQAPYKGPINGPCSACSAGDTAMEHHNHERAQQAPEPRGVDYYLARFRKFIAQVEPLIPSDKSRQFKAAVIALNAMIDDWPAAPEPRMAIIDQSIADLRADIVYELTHPTVPAAQQAEAGNADSFSQHQFIIRARTYFLAGGGGHEDGVEGARAVTYSFEGMLDMAASFAQHELTALKSSQQECPKCLMLQGLIDAALAARDEAHAVEINELKSSQQEEMARTSDNVIELAGKAVRACGGEKSKTILVARILDVELEAVHAAHLAEQATIAKFILNPGDDVYNQNIQRSIKLALNQHDEAEQAKAQEVHQNELDASVTNMLDGCVKVAVRHSLKDADAWRRIFPVPTKANMRLSEERKRAEQTSLASQAKAEKEIAQLRFSIGALNGALAVTERTSLASQAKLIRKCADDAAQDAQVIVTSLGNIESVMVESAPEPFCAVVSQDYERAMKAAMRVKKRILERITPAMLQAEEAALAAEKEGQDAPKV